MDQGTTRYRRDGAIGHVLFDRPQARNAMTWAMYDELAAICRKVNEEPGLRAVTLRGVGGKAFIAGTDIAQFSTFRTGEDGIAYEAQGEAVLSAIEAIRVPTLAVIDGWCVGGGLAIAACCDLRIATPSAQFGVPIARTLGNCLSVANYARLINGFGASRTKRILLLAEMLTAAEARDCGFLSDVVEADALDARVAELTERLATSAPVTMRVSKQAIGRILKSATVDGDDLVRECYASDDFHLGVAAFLAKRKPDWTGR
ncbi:MAG: enoyl-CoA hydratase [Hyphomicrobiales bacterium]